MVDGLASKHANHIVRDTVRVGRRRNGRLHCLTYCVDRTADSEEETVKSFILAVIAILATYLVWTILRSAGVLEGTSVLIAIVLGRCLLQVEQVITSNDS